MTQTARLTFAAAALLALVANAHGGVEHLKGTITKVEGTSITLAIDKGQPVVVATDAKTEFSRGTEKAALKDVVVGDKAVIHAVEHDEHFTAQVVKLGPVGAPKPGSDGKAKTAPKGEAAPHTH